MRIDLVGPSYRSQSLNADAQTTMNWYREIIESGDGNSKSALYPTPGLAVFSSLAETFVTPFYNISFQSSAINGVSGNFTWTPTLPGFVGVNAYVVGQLLVDSNSNVQRVSKAGTSSLSAPTWATSPVGAVTTDTNGVQYTLVKYIFSVGDTIITAPSIDPSFNGSSSGPFHITAITDSISDVWSSFYAVQQFSNSGGRHQTVQGWSAQIVSNVSYGSGITINYTTNGISSTQSQFYNAAFSRLGVAQTPNAQATGTSTVASSGSLSLTATQIAVSIEGAQGTSSLTGGSLFTPIFNGTGANGTQMAFYNPAAAGSVSDSWTAGVSTPWCSTLTAFEWGAIP